MDLDYLPTTRIDQKLTAEQQLTQLVNQANGTFLRLDQLQFGEPQSPDESDSDYTQLETYLKTSVGPRQALLFEYNRLNLNKIGQLIDFQLNVDTNKATEASVQVAGRLALGLPLGHITLVGGFTAGDKRVTFKAVDGSLLCHGQVTFDIMASIADRIQVTALGGYARPVSA